MKFRNDINGLRAIAVLSVVLFHFKIDGFSGGFVGVDVFFVISGYLMTKIIFTKMESKTFSLLSFYIARGQRIIPALTFLCLFLSIFGWFWLIPTEYNLLGEHILGSLTFISNIIYWQEAGYFDAASHSKWLLHTWSLSVEWQFYLLFPLILVVLKRIMSFNFIKILIIFGVIISLLLSIIATDIWPSASYFLLPTRAWQMLIGGLVFLYPMRLKSPKQELCEKLGLFFVAISVIFFSPETLWPSYLALLPVIGTVLILISNRDNSLITSNRFSSYIGKSSYSIYLWHWPVFVLFTYFNLTSFNWLLFGVVLSLAFGALSYEIIEKRFSSNKKNGSVSLRLNHKLFTLKKVFFVITALISTFIVSTSGLESRVNEDVIAAESTKSEGGNPRSMECNVYPKFIGQLKSPKCLYGGSPIDDRIVAIVLGDSHSNMIVNAVAKALKQGAILFMGADGCPSLINYKSDYFKKCGKYNYWVIEEILQNEKYKNIPIIIMNRTSKLVEEYYANVAINDVYQTNPNFVNIFKNEYKQKVCLISKNNPIYIVKPIPEMKKDVPQYLARQIFLGNKNDGLNLPIDDYNKRNERTVGILDYISNECDAKLLDPVEYLCPNNKCIAIDQNDKSYYRDDNHLTEFGSKLLIPMFKTISYN